MGPPCPRAGRGHFRRLRRICRSSTTSVAVTDAMAASVSAVEPSPESGGMAPTVRTRAAARLAAMRITVFRRLMADEFGATRAEMLAKDHVLGGLGGRTVEEALEAGMPAKEIWAQVCTEFEVPVERR